MLKYALIATLAALVASLGWSAYLSNSNARLERHNAALSAEVKTLAARNQNIKEDKESDAEIDDLSDLTVVPDGWLLP